MLENVSVFTYVGGKENQYANMSDEVNTRLSRMSAAFALLSKRVFLNPNIHLVTKLKMFDAVVISNGLYGCATWNISNSQIEKLDSWKFRHLKKILRYKWSDYCSYVDIIDRIKSYGIKIDTMEVTIRKRRLLYLGHVLRMNNCRLPKIMLHADIDSGQRLRGGQELSYRTCIKKDLELFGIPSNTNISILEGLAKDRSKWQRLVNNGAAVLLDKWLWDGHKASYDRHVDEVFFLTWDPVVKGWPSEEVLEDSLKRIKKGEFWKIKEAQKNFTLRSGFKSINNLLDKKYKKMCKVVSEIPSRVSRMLEDMRLQES